MKTIKLLALLTVALTPLWASADNLGHRHSCPQCGCNQTKKVCRLVPDVKKIPREVYSTTCEDFCIPGKSKLCGERCVPDADGCGSHREKVWQPTCGCVKTRTVMVVKTVIDEKPGFKCVVETFCCQCGCNCADGGPNAPQTPAP